jgi:threonine/homoserine/homoserine lactone efflux protein
MTWLVPLAVFAAVSAGSPGPNNLMLWASGAEFGFRRAVPHVLGTAVGIGAMALAVAAGLGALVTAVPAIAFLMKLGGSLYLLYLAWQIAGAGALRPGTVARPLTLVQAAAFQFVNVKGWIFAIGAMTTFRPTDLGIVEGSLAVALTMMVVVVPAAALWAVAGGTIGRLLVSGRRGRAVSLVLAVLLALTVVDVWL